jgi:heme/copper-type cytochrome/quinol oxidase subunit 1
MDLLVSKPHKQIWYSIPMIIVLSIIRVNNTIDIQLHDTYLVIKSLHIGFLFSVILGIIGLVYWVMKEKKLVNWMTRFHVAATIFVFCIIMVTGIIFQDVIEGNLGVFRLMNQFLFVVILIGIISQLVFVVNLFLGLIKR